VSPGGEATAQGARGVRGDGQPLPAVRHPATQPLRQREPAADAPLQHPERRPVRNVRGHTRVCPSAAASPFGHRDDDRRHHRYGGGTPAQRDQASGQDRQGPREAPRLGQVVVGLTHPLRPEVGRRRRQPCHQHVRRVDHHRSRGAQGPHQLEVLEHHVGVPAAYRQDGLPPQAERARPVLRERPVEHRPPGVPPRVPRPAREEVRGAHQVRVREQVVHGPQRVRVVAHVVVRQHHVVVPGQADAGHGADDLGIARRPWVGRQMANGGPERRPGDLVLGEAVRTAAVHHGHLRRSAESLEVVRELAQVTCVRTVVAAIPTQGHDDLDRQPCRCPWCRHRLPRRRCGVVRRCGPVVVAQQVQRHGHRLSQQRGRNGSWQG
jgi:hypothetical protein